MTSDKAGAILTMFNSMASTIDSSTFGLINQMAEDSLGHQRIRSQSIHKLTVYDVHLSKAERKGKTFDQIQAIKKAKFEEMKEK